MKKILLAIVALFVSVMFVNCSESLDSLVNRAKEKLPIEIDEGQTMTDIVIKKDFLQVEFEYDEHEYRLDDDMFDMVLELYGDEFKGMFTEMMADENNGRKLFEKCVEEGLGLRFIMEGKKSKRNLTLVELSAKDLEEELDK